MVELEILTGKPAGTRLSVQQFPIRIGRAESAHVRLQQAGVWDHHLELDFDPQQGFLLVTQQGALAAVNGQPETTTILRNGDSITIGAAQIRFWLGETRQTTLRFREWAIWMLLAAVVLAQIGLIAHWLP